MKTAVPLKDFAYKEDDYEFMFVEQADAFKTTLIVKPKHIKVLVNKTAMSTAELKKFIVGDWFAEGNEQLKLEKKLKRDAKKAETI